MSITMSRDSWVRRPEHLVPGIAVVIIGFAFLVLPIIVGKGMRIFDVYNGLQGFAQFGFVALALGITMMAGEFDLSVAGMHAVGGVVAVMFGTTSPLLGVLVALAVGLILGILQGSIIAFSGVSSLPVTLGSLIALMGLASFLSGGLSLTYTNVDATIWIDQPLLAIFSPRSLMLFGLFAAAAVLLGSTPLGRNLRAVGGDRRSAKVAGVRVKSTLVGAFAASGSLASLGGALLAYSYSSANPDPGQQLLIVGVVAALLGGASLAGGRGKVMGLLCGALSVALLSQLTTMLAVPSFVTQLAFAAFLIVIVIVDAPGLRTQLQRIVARSVAIEPTHERVEGHIN